MVEGRGLGRADEPVLVAVGVRNDSHPRQSVVPCAEQLVERHVVLPVPPHDPAPVLTEGGLDDGIEERRKGPLRTLGEGPAELVPIRRLGALGANLDAAPAELERSRAIGPKAAAIVAPRVPDVEAVQRSPERRPRLARRPRSI